MQADPVRVAPVVIRNQNGVVVPRTRVHNLFVSLDGFAAGETVTLEEPIGAARALFGWFDGRGIDGVDRVPDAPIVLHRGLTSMWGQGIGAEIMGRRKFGPQAGPWVADGWQGWWGDDPPFRTPVFVLTHHHREPISFANGTSFHFVAGSPTEVLALAREAAGGKDVRIGGGPSTVRQFLRDDLIDFMHLVTVPLVLGRGVSLWDGLAGVQDRFDIESIGDRDGVVHQLWNRK